MNINEKCTVDSIKINHIQPKLCAVAPVNADDETVVQFEIINDKDFIYKHYYEIFNVHRDERLNPEDAEKDA